MNYPIEIPPAVYEALCTLLQHGTVDRNGNTVDFSPVQQITISNGTATFSPPAKLTAKFGFINIRTTISSVAVKGAGIKLEVDNSPIDIEVRPA